VKEFAEYLGIDVEQDKDLLWIAVDAMTAKLPEHWVEVKPETGQSYFYFKRTGHTQWEHPLDEYYRGLYIKLKQEKENRKSFRSHRRDISSIAQARVSAKRGRIFQPSKVSLSAASEPLSSNHTFALEQVPQHAAPARRSSKAGHGNGGQDSKDLNERVTSELSEGGGGDRRRNKITPRSGAVGVGSCDGAGAISSTAR
jgi:hypothetical protein